MRQAMNQKPMLQGNKKKVLSTSGYTLIYRKQILYAYVLCLLYTKIMSTSTFCIIHLRSTQVYKKKKNEENAFANPNDFTYVLKSMNKQTKN